MGEGRAGEPLMLGRKEAYGVLDFFFPVGDSGCHQKDLLFACC
jgi:hypothetical protein